MRLIALTLICACSCLGGDPDSRDASTDDARLRDVSTEALGDASLGDTGSDLGDARSDGDTDVDRLVGPGEMEPPETMLEPGSGADDAYRYCWYLAGIICQGIYGCCPIPTDILGDDQEECAMRMREGACEVYLERPDAFGAQDRDALERNLTLLEEAAVGCAQELVTVKFGYLLGDIDIGGDCSAESLNPHLLCRDGLPCVDGVCSAIPEIGEPCGGGWGPSCVSAEAYCGDDHQCVAWGTATLGEGCASAVDCESRLCREDMCVPLSDANFWCFGHDD